MWGVKGYQVNRPADAEAIGSWRRLRRKRFCRQLKEDANDAALGIGRTEKRPAPMRGIGPGLVPPSKSRRESAAPRRKAFPSRGLRLTVKTRPPIGDVAQKAAKSCHFVPLFVIRHSLCVTGISRSQSRRDWLPWPSFSMPCDSSRDEASLPYLDQARMPSQASRESHPVTKQVSHISTKPECRVKASRESADPAP